VALAVVTHRQVATWQNSVVLFEHALKAGGDNDFIRGALATTLMTEGRDKEAEPHLLAAVRLAPDHYEHHVNLASLWLRQGNIQGASVEIDKAIKLAPTDAAAHELRASVLLRSRDYSGAIEEMKEAVRLGFDRTQAAVMLNDNGASLAQRGELKNAEMLLRTACEVQPSLLEAQKNLALVLNDQGRTDAARERIRIGLTIAPRSPELRDVAVHLGVR
jgi:Flp pilus assembly protein TadD